MMPCYFIGTLSQTISIPLTPFSRGHIRPSCAPELGAIASLFFGWHLMMPVLIPPTPFSRGQSGPTGFPSPLGLPCSPAPARHLKMPCYFFGTLSQTISIPLTPFSRGHIRPSCSPELGAIASLFFGRHLMMPYLIPPPIPLTKGAIRAYGLSIAAMAFPARQLRPGI